MPSAWLLVMAMEDIQTSSISSSKISWHQQHALEGTTKDGLRYEEPS